MQNEIISINIIDESFYFVFSGRSDFIFLFLSNIIISIFTIVTIGISLYNLININKKDYEIEEDYMSLIRTNRGLYIGIYWILLSLVGCMFISIRLFINSEWINLIGIIFIACFYVYSKRSKILKIYFVLYNKANKMMLSQINNHKLCIYEYIYNNNIAHTRRIINPITQDKELDTQRITKIINSMPFKLIHHTYFFELINSIVSIICMILVVINFYRNVKWRNIIRSGARKQNIYVKYDVLFNLRLINLTIIFITFAVSAVYVILSIKKSYNISIRTIIDSDNEGYFIDIQNGRKVLKQECINFIQESKANICFNFIYC